MQTDLGHKLIAVMDIHVLKLFTAEGLKIIGNVGVIDLKSGNDHREEKQQSFHGNKNGQGSHFDPHTDVKEIDLKDASKKAIENIESYVAKNGSCKEIIIVSDAKMLGSIRPQLSGNLQKLVSKELSKDLTHHSIESIEKFIFS